MGTEPGLPALGGMPGGGPGTTGIAETGTSKPARPRASARAARAGSSPAARNSAARSGKREISRSPAPSSNLPLTASKAASAGRPRAARPPSTARGTARDRPDGEDRARLAIVPASIPSSIARAAASTSAAAGALPPASRAARAFCIPGAPGARVAVRYAEGDLLASGWLLGERFVRGRAAVVEVHYWRGRVILPGFSPYFRAQPHGTFKLLFNALYRSSVELR